MIVVVFESSCPGYMCVLFFSASYIAVVWMFDMSVESFGCWNYFRVGENGDGEFLAASRSSKESAVPTSSERPSLL